MKLYFQTQESEICYNESYFRKLLEDEGLTEITIYRAKRQDVDGFFWCRFYLAAGDLSEGTCGKFCKHYTPRNGISGCCVHYSKEFYEPTSEEKVIKK